MNHYSICENPQCRLVLDRDIDGKTPSDAHLLLKQCPCCGSAWSSICPFCSQGLTIKIVNDLPQFSCCGHTLGMEAKAA
jgi:hypothetical protein